MQRRGVFALALLASMMWASSVTSAQDTPANPTPLPTIFIVVATDTPGAPSLPLAEVTSVAEETSTNVEVSATPLPETPNALTTPGFARGIEVFIQGQDVAALTAQLSQLNVSWIRLSMNWRDVEIVRGTLNLTPYDTAIETFSQAGFNVMLTLTGAPDWSRPSATPFVLSLPQYGPPDNLQDFAFFAGTIAARYAGLVDAYEVWSEPNLRRSWIDPTTTSRETARMADVRYIDLLSAAYTAIKTADPAALVVSAGLAPTGLNDLRNSIDDEVFLTALFEQGLSEVVDAVGVQPDGFANPPSVRCCTQSEGVLTHYENKKFYFLDTLESYRSIMIQAGVDKPLWVTRFGWGTAEGNKIVSPNMNENPFFSYNSPQEQADYTAEALSIAQNFGGIGTAFLFNLNGCQVGQGEACFYSLIDSNNQARPIFSVMAQN